MEKNNRQNLVRSFVFGVEDSLVSTIGLISGVTTAGMEKSSIVVTGFVLIFVEAFSMGVGTLLSDNSAQEFQNRADVSLKKSYLSALIMFISYVIAGFLIVFPYLILDSGLALPISIATALVALFFLGTLSARFSHIDHWAKKGLIMASLGGLAIAIGVFVGFVAS